jgi:OOP family OmpA-OmpF porin
MTTAPVLRLLSLAGLGSLLSLSALAQTTLNNTDNYFYGGATVGKSRAKLDSHSTSAAAITGPGLTQTTISSDDTDVGYKIFGGYQISPRVGVEGGYFSLGKTRFSNSTVPTGTLDGDSRYHGMNLDLVGNLPLSDRWAALARIGVQRTETKTDFTGTGAAAPYTQNRKMSDTDYKLGIGMQYAITPSVLLRGEAERFRVKDAVGTHGNINLLSVSLVFPFGGGNTPPMRVAMAPVAPPPAPMPPPVVAAAPVVQPPPVVVMPAPQPVAAAPQPRRVSFSADSLFAFDQAAVRPEGRAALDTFTREIQGVRFETITVEGHTDRLGTPAYNHKLSLQRAEAVKSYLASSDGVSANKMVTVGKGESMPVTKPGDCKGNKPSAELITCLQPDRRVEVEVTGTR